ncbi:MAG: cell division protein FtsW [Elusimicrobiaceae bacterium]|nr:cell division protein FtsW [Elusimicrobiaceae bacterium]
MSLFSANTKNPRRRPVLARSTAFRPSRPRQEGWQPLKLDSTLAFISLAFVLIGLLFTYSASAFETSAYVKRQVVFDLVGIGAALFLSQTFTRILQFKIFRPMNLMYLTWVLLIIVLFTRTQAHTHRWIDLGFIKLQPSEIAKVTLVIYLADYLEKTAGKLAKNWQLLIPPMGVGGITLFLILLEKDLGTPLLMGGVFFCMLFVAGARLLHLGVPVLVAGLGGVIALLAEPYRRARVLSFLHMGGSAEETISYQVRQSFMAVGSGGWLGKGLGNSELKMQYLPAAHTDFIFSVMCEEAGLFVLIVVFGFAWLLYRGIALARIAKTTFNSLVIFGLTLTICSQAFFNMAMAIGLLPTKGIALPFFSYGGSSVVMTLVMMGIVLNVVAVDHTQNNLRSDVTHYKNRNK